MCGQCQQVQQAIDKASDPKLQNILQQLRNYSNIPRKKAKFEVCYYTRSRSLRVCFVCIVCDLTVDV